jgi:hypothetical protein
LQGGLDHAKRAQPALFSGLHGGGNIFLNGVEEGHGHILKRAQMGGGNAKFAAGATGQIGGASNPLLY